MREAGMIESTSMLLFFDYRSHCRREHDTTSMRLIIGISGATGAIYGIRLLEQLSAVEGIETHVVMTPSARQAIVFETGRSVAEVRELADAVYSERDVGAIISSGSFKTDGMIVAPCSIKTLSGIAHSYDDNLLVRAADVCLKERRKLVLLLRETPLHIGHIRLMLAAAENGAILMPPVPAFYAKPQSVDDIVNQTVGRVLDQFGIELDNFTRWQGLRPQMQDDIPDGEL